MGDGMHCRPALESFPPGTEWILALNGPGSKHGKGLAILHCGEYCLLHRSFSSRFKFILEPTPTSWTIVVKEFGRNENFARLMPLLHFVPHPREIEGWHLSDNPSGCISRTYRSETDPGNPRRFIFSPDVGCRIDDKQTGRPVSVEEIEDVRRFGRGAPTIKRFQLEPGKNGCPKIRWMEFSVHLEGGY